MSVHTSAKIHRTAIIEKGAVVGQDVVIGPYTHIYGCVSLAPNVKIQGFCSIGSPPETLWAERITDEPKRVVIGEYTEIREYVTINEPCGALTRVGHHCLLCTKSHVGHDAILGAHVVLAISKIGGHTVIGDYCFIGLNASTHPRAVLGRACIVGAQAFFKGESYDGLKWVGTPAKILGVNYVGIKKSYIPESEQTEITMIAESAWKAIRPYHLP